MVVCGVKMTALPAGSSAFTLAVVVFELFLPVELASLSVPVPVAVPVAEPLASSVAEASLAVVIPAVFRFPAFAGSSVADAVAVGAGEDAARGILGQSPICTRDVARFRVMGETYRWSQSPALQPEHRDLVAILARHMRRLRVREREGRW